jgi:hypothetical protein
MILSGASRRGLRVRARRPAGGSSTTTRTSSYTARNRADHLRARRSSHLVLAFAAASAPPRPLDEDASHGIPAK